GRHAAREERERGVRDRSAGAERDAWAGERCPGALSGNGREPGDARESGRGAQENRWIRRRAGWEAIDARPQANPPFPARSAIATAAREARMESHPASQ